MLATTDPHRKEKMKHEHLKNIFADFFQNMDIIFSASCHGLLCLHVRWHAAPSYSGTVHKLAGPGAEGAASLPALRVTSVRRCGWGECVPGQSRAPLSY